MNVFTRIAVPVLSALLLAGCAGTSQDTVPEATETLCVVSGEPAGDGPTALFMGQTVHFCCDRCLAKWDGMSDEAKKAAVAVGN